jgi:hypothetical protein
MLLGKDVIFSILHVSVALLGNRAYRYVFLGKERKCRYEIQVSKKFRRGIPAHMGPFRTLD